MASKQIAAYILANPFRKQGIDPKHYGQMPLPSTKIQELLSVSYVKAIIARAGFGYSYRPDGLDFGVDLDVVHVKKYAGKYREAGAVLSLQLKATTILREDPKHIKFQLTKDAFDRLTSDSVVPRVLIVYLMPAKTSAWLSHSAKALILRKLGYYISATNLPPFPAGQNSVTVSIPKKNKFNVGAVTALAHAHLAKIGISP